MNDYSNSEVGLPQGSPISPVLIQSFLHQLDLQFDAMAQEENGDSTKYVYFARYADDILFGIPIVGVGVMSKVFFRRLQEVLDRMSSKLRLKLTSIVLQRWRAPAVEEGKDRFANQIIGCYIQTH
jgi:retron-type reverse transcriptase